MTERDIELAKKCFDERPEGYLHFDNEKFIDLIRADEREACALICDDQARSAYWEGADACATEIRARGDK